MNAITMQGYKRIGKAQANKLFVNGQDIRVVPCKMIPDNSWNNQDWNIANFANALESSKDKLFENLINSWSYYNACHELGYYPAFYIKA